MVNTKINIEKLRSFFASLKKVEILEKVPTFDGKSYYMLKVSLEVSKKKKVIVHIAYSTYAFVNSIFDKELEEEIIKDRMVFFDMLVEYLNDDMLKGNYDRIHSRSPSHNNMIHLTDNLRDIKGYKVKEISLFVCPKLYLENGDCVGVGLGIYKPGNTDITRIELLEYIIREIEERNLEEVQTLPYLKKELECYKKRK